MTILKHGWRLAIIDITAMNVFSLLIAVPIEWFSGYSYHEIITTRSIAAIVNSLTGRLYGIWRDRFQRLVQGYLQRWDFVRNYLVDTAAFISFQLPLYWICAFLGGARMREVLAASAGLTLLAGLSGGPYGLFLDRCRRIFGVTVTRHEPPSPGGGT